MEASGENKAMFDLNGRVAIVTGGSSGIGFAIAGAMAAAGARVAVVARTREKVEAAAQAIRAAGGECYGITTDLTDEASVNHMVDDVVAQFGRLDILVNNAGSNIRKPLQDLSPTEWHTVIDANLTSTYLATKAVYIHLQNAGGGKIINIGSMMSIFGASFAPAYGAAKGAIVQFTKAMAVSWAPDGIQVNAILPGWIATDMGQKAIREVAGLDARVKGRTPAGRWGKAEDLAGISVFLASAASNFVTGTAIPVDGGYSVSP